MRFKIFTILLVGFLFSLATSTAQTISVDNLNKIKVSQLSDAQILQIWQRFEQSGVSETDATRLLIARGLPAEEVAAFKKRLEMVRKGGLTSSKSLTGTAEKEDIDYSRDTMMIAEEVPVKRVSNIYGYEFFSNPNLKFEPDMRIATPKNYVLGPDDEVIILLTGLNESSVRSKITPEGNLQIPYAGLVYLSGFTIEQAHSIIKKKMQKVYPGLANGQTQLTVNLGNVRSIRVTIIGEVVQPGTYTIASVSTLFNALYQSGGPSDRGSLRNIEVIRNNKVVKSVDFYSFLQKGILSGNVRLEDQDVIRIPVYTKRVEITGEVKRPGQYELKETETLEDLIRYAGGFSDVAYKAMAKVVQMGDKEKNVKDVPNELFDRFVPRNADSFYFEPISGRFANRVVLEGAVYRPGVFELTPQLTLSQLIEKADGIRDDAFMSRGYIKRVKPDLEKEMISFDLSQILKKTSADIPLMREDSVFVLSNVNLKDELSVTIEGFVRAPGTFVYRKGMKLADAIAMAGGFTNDAANHRIEISRLVNDRTDSVANKLLDIVTLEVDSTLSSGKDNFSLEPLDYIYVPRLVNYRSLGNVTVRGEVLFPGDYSLQRRDETAQEFIERAGGITPSGSLAHAQVFRHGVRVDADLLRKKSSKEPLVLLAGDSIFVPRKVTLVEVNGAVNNPQMLAYSGRGFKQYIRGAGGVKQNGKLKNAYVQYPDGINKPVGRFLFFRTYPSVQPGSRIIVPETTGTKIKIGLGEVSAITSALTAIVTLISVLSR